MNVRVGRQGGRRGAGLRLIMALVVAGAAIFSFLGSQEYNPVTGENQYISLTQEQEIALGLQATPQMTGRSLLDILTSTKSGRIDRRRDHVLTGKERHAWVRRDGLGYPCRAIRTHEFLYIRNFKPDRWPAGHPIDGGEPYYSNRAYGDIDGAPSKTYMMEHRNHPDVQELFELAFEKRPAEELYDLRQDPHQLTNVADRRAYARTRAKLASRFFWA